jgi:hypothetical protein
LRGKIFTHISQLAIFRQESDWRKLNKVSLSMTTCTLIAL